MGLILLALNPLSRAPRSRSTHHELGHAPYLSRKVVSSPDHRRVPFVSQGHTWYSPRAPPGPHPHTSPYEFTLSSKHAVPIRTTTHRVPTLSRFPSLRSDPETDIFSFCKMSPTSLLCTPSLPRPELSGILSSYWP